MNRKFSLRIKLFLAFGGILLISVLLLGLTNFFIASHSMKQEGIDKLERIVDSIADSMDFLMRSHIETHLTSTAEKTKHIIELYYKTYSQAEAYRKTRELILDPNYGKIGKTGYIAGVSSKGILSIHPKSEGTDASSHEFMRRAIAKREGYLEYEWQNPGETAPRLKAGGMAYFEPFDLIIWVSSYMEEFKDMLKTETISNYISSIRFGQNGYVFVMDGLGKLLIHPTSVGKNISNLPHIQEIIQKKNGHISYVQQTEGVKQGKLKYNVYRYIPRMDWYVVGGSYEEEIFENAINLSWANIALLGVSVVLILLIGFFFTNSILKIIKVIIKKLQNISSGSERADLTQRLEISSHDEIAEIAREVNALMRKLNGELRNVENATLEVIGFAEKTDILVKSGMESHIRSIKDGITKIDRQTENATAGAEELSATVEEIVRNIDSINNNMERQASAVEESASSIEEMVRNIENTSNISNKTKDISKNLNGVAKEGGKAVRASITSIKEISEFSRQIIKMLQLITNIAKQTNLLAMNAAIEAAHAGEAGKGFAIVADEIRRLSEDTNKNAKDITEVVNSIVGRIEDSVKLAEKAGIGLDMIIAYSEQNVQTSSQLSLTLEEQNMGAKEILRTTQELVQITEEVKLSMNEQKNATTDFSKAIAEIRDLSIDNKEATRLHIDNVNALISSIETIKANLAESKKKMQLLMGLIDKFVLTKDEPEETGLKLLE